MQFAKNISTSVDQLARRVVKVLRFGRADVQTSLQAAPYGVDSNPIKDMIAVYSDTSEKGKTVIVGYINKNQIASPGEHRIFSTDGSGTVMFAIYLKNDGTCEMGGNGKNLARFQELQTGFNALKSDLNKLVTAFNTHVHPTAATGPPSIPTAVPTVIPATASTASIDAAKIDEIKTL